MPTLPGPATAHSGGELSHDLKNEELNCWSVSENLGNIRKIRRMHCKISVNVLLSENIHQLLRKFHQHSTLNRKRLLKNMNLL